MKTTATAVKPAAPFTTAECEETFDKIRKSIALYGVVSAIVLGTVAALTLATNLHGTPFMWIRGGILLALTPLLLRWASRAARGDRGALKRLTVITTTLPVAVIGIDLIPGMCPTWYAVMQGISVLPLIAVTILARGTHLRRG
ncbi:hypothetical protein [Fodinicola acaciae]|uniref:hypothetical protein n=1 Tax=Fodinicola acaciae TaxID=2681555 RepID=UPI0013D75E6D|nr:hypothetical protein [Fodinicola acaciae]